MSGPKHAELRAILGMPRICGICNGTGKLPAYRGPTSHLRCHFCDGTGETPARATHSERMER